MKEKMEATKYYKPTTFAQIKIMIDIYLKTHNISQSCKRAKIGVNPSNTEVDYWQHKT